MISRILCLVILVIIGSFPIVSTLQLPLKVMAQVPPSEGAKVLIDDVLQALKSNDTNRAQIHLNILNQQLPTLGNSSSIQLVKVLLDDAASNLKNNNITKAIVHLNLIKQQFANTTNNAPLINNPSTSKLSTLSNGTISNAANGYVFIKKWGSKGTGDGQFNFPESTSLYFYLAIQQARATM